ncbi:MAG: TRAM domain-containing protein [Candidatus Bathyarchaeota archaeon]|nr:TRAM domain-containing protein [Candidatus Bathyarchaeota archaeon]
MGGEYEVEITEIMSNGEGLAAVKGFWIFVPNVKVGDKVNVKVTSIDSVSADAEVINQN